MRFKYVFLGQIKNLAGQTMWYGGSNVASKFLSYLVTPLLTYLLSNAEGMADVGSINILYAYFAVMNIFFTYGMETGYFRFSNRDTIRKQSLFETTFGSLLLSTILLCGLLFWMRVPIEKFIRLNGHTEYIALALIIIGLDALSAIPFAKLRQENRPKKYAFIKVTGVFINLVLIVFFIAILPKIAKPGNIWFVLSSRLDTVSLILMANIIQNAFVFLALFSEWKIFSFKWDAQLWRAIFKYSSPMIIIGLAGMINEVMDRQFLNYWAPGTDQEKKITVAIYSANYKLSIVITMFIQAFKLAAEPFFFNQAKDKAATGLYARVMDWFVIVLCTAFLITALFLDFWKYFEQYNYRAGLSIVPILLFANIFSGIYYNLSIWYKLKDKMVYGVLITLIGATVTVIGNYYFIPRFGMLAAAWTTCICYILMTVTCYAWGQKYFKVPYNVKKIVSYLSLMLIVFFVQEIIKEYTDNLFIRVLSGLVLMLVFFCFIVANEKQDMKRMPILGKFVKKFVA